MGAGLSALLIVLVGVFCAFCAYKDYDWFMDNHRAWLLVKLFGRNGARVFYIILGVLLMAAGLVLY